MFEFKIEGKEGYIELAILEVFGFPQNTSHNGGYDAKGYIKIKSRGYYAEGEIWISTGEVYLLYEGLKSAYEKLEGKVEFYATDGNYLKVDIEFLERGNVSIKGVYEESYTYENELKFTIDSNQSYFEQTLRDLKLIVDEYGDMQGKR